MRYVFEPEDVKEVVHRSLRKIGSDPLEPLLRDITSELAARYPGLIEEQWVWVFCVVGGGNQQLTTLYISPWEYVTIVSSPVSTDGFTGRYWTTIHDFIVSGRILCYAPGQFTPMQYSAGSHLLLEPGRGYCFEVPEHLCMVEYTRGPIPTMFLLPVINTVFGTFDFPSLWQLIKHNTKLMWRSFWRRPRRRVAQPPNVGNAVS